MPDFQRRHYQAIADAINRSAQLGEDGEVDLVVLTILADLFKRDNPNFNKDKFLTACTKRRDRP